MVKKEKMTVETFKQLDAQKAIRAEKLRDEAEKARQSADAIAVQMEEALAASDTELFTELYAKRAAFESAAAGYVRMIDEAQKPYSDADIRSCWVDYLEGYAKPYEAAKKKYDACKADLVDAFIAFAKEQNKMLGIAEALESRLENGGLAQFPKMPEFSPEFRTVFADELAARGMSTNPMNPCPLAFIANKFTGGKYVREFK